MADSVVDRREARRRRILENSQSRLEKITGKAEKVKPPTLFDGTDSRIRNGLIHPEEEHSEHDPSSHTDTSRFWNFVDDNEATSVSTTGYFSPWPVWVQQYLDKNLHFAVLAVIVRLLHLFEFGYLFGESVLVPFTLTTLLCYMKSPPRLVDNSLVNMLGIILLLAGRPPKSIVQIKKIIIYIMYITYDLIVYLISFVTFHVFLEKLVLRLGFIYSV